MDTVLIVDGDQNNLKRLEQGFTAINHFRALFSPSGKEALDMIDSENISVLVTDINTLEIDGVELLAYMSRKHPSTPCILMTEYGKPWFRDNINQEDVLYHVEKPVDPGILASAIFVGLNLLDEGVSLKGMALTRFLPIIELEQKTCRLEVSSPVKGRGYFYFLRGDLIDAHYRDFSPDQAAMEMIGWENCAFKLSDLPMRRHIKRIQTTLMDLVGASWKKSKPVTPPRRPISFRSTHAKALHELSPGTTVTRKASGNGTVASLKDALEAMVPSLRAIKGYEAIGILDDRGNVLAADMKNRSIDLKHLGSTFADLMRLAHSTAWANGLESCYELTLHTAAHTLMLHRYEIEPSVIQQVIGLTETDGSWYYMKIQINDMVAKIKQAMNAN